VNLKSYSLWFIGLYGKLYRNNNHEWCELHYGLMQTRDTDAMPFNTSDYGFKLCVHYFACLCAFASNESLAAEFEHVLSSAAQEVSGK
jgi:hypothetical protein